MFDEQKFQQSTVTVDNIKEKGSDTIPAWFAEKRLPTLKEMQENKNGFPSVEEEKMLQQLFFAKMRPQIIPFFMANGGDELSYSLDMSTEKRQKNITEFTPQQIEQVCAYLYGIYFYNYASKGRIFDHKLNYLQTKKAERKANAIIDATADDQDSYDRYVAVNKLATTVLDPSKIEDWPIKVYPGALAYQAKASANTNFLYINVILERFQPAPLTKKEKVIAKKGTGLFKRGELSYQAYPVPEWIRTGIEEASHIDFTFLRSKRFEAAEAKRRKITGEAVKIFLGNQHLREYGPLKNLGDRSIITDNISQSESIIDYNALIANEFAAHIVQAAYTQKYDPETWNSGYSEYDTAVRARRKEKAT